MKKLEKKNKGGLWNATFGELIATFQILEKNGFTLEMLKQLREKGGEEKAKRMIAVLKNATGNQTRNSVIEKELLEWQEFYAKYFHLDLPDDFSKIKIPTPSIGFNRLLIIIPGVSLSDIIYIQNHWFRTRITGDIYESISRNDRDVTNGPYAIWVRDTVGPDAQYLKHSANWVKEKHIKGETLLERLIHGFKFWHETQKQLDVLDVNGVTLCTGSRFFDGSVPRVHFGSDGAVNISQHHPAQAIIDFGLREVISC